MLVRHWRNLNLWRWGVDFITYPCRTARPGNGRFWVIPVSLWKQYSGNEKNPDNFRSEYCFHVPAISCMIRWQKASTWVSISLLCIRNLHVKDAKNAKSECIFIKILLRNSIKSKKINSFSSAKLNIINMNHTQFHLCWKAGS